MEGKGGREDEGDTESSVGEEMEMGIKEEGRADPIRFRSSLC